MTLGDELEGTLVVSLEQAVAAPYCGVLLANAGARVIKVERPEGDFARGYDAGAKGQSTIFAWLNRGKEAICLDLKTPEDLVLLRNILNDADVLVSNLVPGAMARFGLTGDILRASNPGLITCEISGYGESKAASHKKAYDFLVQGEVGVCAVTGTPDGPARVGVPLTDLSTGLTAFSAILRALLKRAKTGKGIDINISMFDVVADWMNMPLLAHRYMGGAPKRAGLMHTFIAPYGAFQCGDGGHVLLSVQNNREFAALCRDVLMQPDLPQDPRFAQNPDRYANREALNAMVIAAFDGCSTDQVIAKLDAAQIANARLNSVAQVSKHPFLRNAQAQMGEAKIDMAALPVQTTGPECQTVPLLNQDGPNIRAEFSAKAPS